MGIDCTHGSFTVERVADFESGSSCPDCRLARIEELLRALVDILSSEHEGSARERAIRLWSLGQGKHPDD